MRYQHVAAILGLLPAALQGQQARPWQSTDYYRLTVVSNPALSPDGRRVAFVVTTVVEDKDRRHNEIWLAPGGEAFQIKGVHALLVFSRDGKSLVYAWRGNEPDSLKKESWRNRVSPTAITRGPDPKRFDGRVYTSIPIVGDERGYLAPRETRRPSHLYVVPLAGGTPRQLTSGELSQSSPAWSPDGKTIAFEQDTTENQEMRDDSWPALFLLTVEDGTTRPLAPAATTSQH